MRLQHSRVIKHGRILGAVLVGNLPGFVVPFIAYQRLEPADADVLLLLASTAVTLATVVTMTVETAWAASVGTLLAHGRRPGSRIARRGALQAAGFALGVSGVLGPLVLALYALARPAGGEGLIGPALTLVPAPLAAAAASVYGGVAVANGRVALPTALQGAKFFLPVGLLLLSHTPSIWLVTSSYAFGEIVRLCLLRIYCRTLMGTDRKSQAAIPSGKLLVSHFASLAVTLATPVIDRSFLSRFPPGSITAFEMADRFYFAVYQIAIVLTVTRPSGAWSRELTQASPHVVIRRRVLGVCARVAVLAALGAGSLALLLLVPQGLVPDQSILWALVLLPGLVAGVGQTAVTRFAVMCRATRVLPLLGVISVIINAASNALGVAAFGIVGVIISTTVTRVVVFAISLVWILRTVERNQGTASTLSMVGAEGTSD